MTRKKNATLRAPKKAKKAPVHRIRRGRHELEPVYGIRRPVRNFVVTKERVIIPPSEIGMVEVDDLWVNDEYQRELLANGIDDLIEKYQGLSFREACELFRNGCGFTLSTLRSDGKVSKIDGQRRLALAKWIKDTYGVKEFFIHTELVETEDDEDEAKLFNSRNHRKSLTDCQLFKGELKAGVSTSVAIDGILAGHGICIRGTRKKGSSTPVNCVNAVKKAYFFDGTGNNLDSTLTVISSAWLCSPLPKVRKQGVRAAAIRAVSIFLKERQGVNLKVLATKLARYSMKAIEAYIPANSANSGHTRYEEMAKEVGRIYDAPVKRTPQIVL